jgi:hypothetical protein
MNQVQQLEEARAGVWWFALIQRIERSRLARLAVCSGAFLIGGFPFLVVAWVARFLGV